MGNSDAHEPFYELMGQQPGLVVLHDWNLHHFVAHRTAGQGHLAGYSREMAFARGENGRKRAWQLRLGVATQPVQTWPLNQRLLTSSLGLLVHSYYVKQQALAQAYQRPIVVTSQPLQPSATTAPPAPALRQRLGVPPEALLLASVGQITPAKQIDLALNAFVQLRQQQQNAYYLLVGEPNGDVDLAQHIRALGLEPWVKQVGFVPDLAQFSAWIKTADFIVNLRHPTVGETSATALRALAMGRPVLVFDHGWYAELPDSVALKVPPLDQAALLAGMQQLANSALRQKMGAAAQAYVAATCAPATIVQDYRTAYDAIMQQIGQKYA